MMIIGFELKSIDVLSDTEPCPSNYEEGPNGHCYWFRYSYDRGYWWYWARQDCMSEPDSDLLIINDDVELAFIRERITEINETKDWWIGI